MKYFDTHIHLLTDNTDEQIGRYVRQKREKEDHIKIVLIGPRTQPGNHERLFEVCSKYPDFFIPFPWVDLSKPEEIDVQAFFDRGAVGLKFINPYIDYDDQRFFPAYQRAEELGMPILFHTGIAGGNNMGPRGVRGISTARMKPEFLDTIARAFPDLVIFGAHLGNPWYEISLEVMRYNRNVHWDICGTTLTKKMTAEWWARIQWERESRKQFVYGTDEIPVLQEEGTASHYTTGLEAHQSFVERIGWTEEEIEGYFYRNALGIFRDVYKKQGRAFKE